MSTRTRYLQINPTTMLEFEVNEYDESINYSESSDNNLYVGKLICAELLNGHKALLSPASFEVEKTDKGYGKKKQDEIVTINNINHFSVPVDKNENRWFMFLDPDYKYTTDENVGVPDASSGDLKVMSYIQDFDAKHQQPRVLFKSLDVDEDDHITYSTIKLYFTNGYDFTDMFGALIRLSVVTDDDKYVDLCNFVYTRSDVYKYLGYIMNPIVFGNFIYDRYLEIKVPSVSDLINTGIGDLNIKANTTLKLMFSYISENDVEIGSIETKEFSENKLVTITVPNVLCKYSRANNIKASIPPSSLPSDNLGVHIESSPSKSYIEFYGTWKGLPLSPAIVQRFNKDIKLYDQSIVRRGEVVYEVDKDYTPENNLKKWVAMHEITCKLINMGNDVVDEETYEVSQVFDGKNSDPKTFYYRPVIFDDTIIQMINDGTIGTMIIEYSLRFMNVYDSVQFLKHGSITFTSGELIRFCKNTTNLNFSERLPYKIYNKIVEQKQSVPSRTYASEKSTKYIKTFYNSNTITVMNDGTALENGVYELQLSPAPKNYKFVFKQEDMNGNFRFMDLTDTYYKLYAKGKDNVDIVIEPTYSKNMNMVMGELEFNINASDISKLQDVPSEKRTISIVAYNSDNSVSSMYDMKYYFV